MVQSLKSHKKFLYVLFILCLFNPLYRRVLGELNLNFILYIFYGALVLFGLTVITRTGLKPIKIVVPIFIFSIWYFASNVYSISNDTFEKSILILLIPFYILGAVGSSKIDFNMRVFLKVWFWIILIYTIYATFTLLAEGFNFTLFYLKPQIVDYLTYSTLTLPFCFYSLTIGSNKLYKYVSYYFLIFSIISGARVPVLAFALIFVFWLLKKKKFKYIFLTCTVVVAMLYFFNESFSLYFEYFLIRFQSIGSDDNSINERFLYLDKSFDSIFSYPYFGRGINSSGIVLTGTDNGYYPHNFIVETLVEIGFIGLIPLLLFFLSILKIGFMTKNNDRILSLLLVVFFLLFNFMKSFSITEIRYLVFFITLYYINCQVQLNKANKCSF